MGSGERIVGKYVMGIKFIFNGSVQGMSGGIGITAVQNLPIALVFVAVVHQGWSYLVGNASHAHATACVNLQGIGIELGN